MTFKILLSQSSVIRRPTAALVRHHFPEMIIFKGATRREPAVASAKRASWHSSRVPPSHSEDRLENRNFDCVAPTPIRVWVPSQIHTRRKPKKKDQEFYFRYTRKMIPPAPKMTPPVTKRMGRNSPKIKMIAPSFIRISAWARLFPDPSGIFFPQIVHTPAGSIVSVPHSGHEVKVSPSMTVRSARDNYLWKLIPRESVS